MSPQLYRIESGPQSGPYNMALDEFLLEELRQSSAETPVLVVRTYEWEVPTLSLGVNQSVQDVNALLYDLETDVKSKAVVRRPTGGRAIPHGEDVSFSFVTNDPALVRLSLKDSYCALTQWLKDALRECGVQFAGSCETDGKSYTRSPVCFETLTPSDLLDAQGRKMAGSAQLRRQGGILQHGAAFLKPYKVSAPIFSHALFTAVAGAYGMETLEAFPWTPERKERLKVLIDRYASESAEILERASTTAGSHFSPASS